LNDKNFPFAYRQLLRKGKSEPWEKIVEDLFNITKLNTEPLLEYFKPLETFLDAGANFKENSTDNTKAFSANDLTSMFTSSSVKTGDKKKGKMTKKMLWISLSCISSREIKDGTKSKLNPSTKQFKRNIGG